MSGAAYDIKKACKEELEAIEKDNDLGCEVDDADIVLEEYFSDDEKENDDKITDGDTEAQITKVCLFSFQLMRLLCFGIDTRNMEILSKVIACRPSIVQ